MQATDPSGNDHGALSAISNEMVRVYKEQFGRGPTKTRTQWAGPDVLLVTLEQTFTPAERRLRELGEHGRLRELRLLFQYAEVSIFCEPIERLTGRTVRAFISGIDTEADIASELFVLYPAGTEGLSRRVVDDPT
ncbi:MAG TPA: Na-translocating system protein MpsC family protein [Solirubrobacteraceae bacterium]|nr:Na-translocating system protein MpsC family protein [Solirubrobacteraceae bacterium]